MTRRYWVQCYHASERRQIQHAPPLPASNINQYFTLPRERGVMLPCRGVPLRSRNGVLPDREMRAESRLFNNMPSQGSVMETIHGKDQSSRTERTKAQAFDPFSRSLSDIECKNVRCIFGYMLYNYRIEFLKGSFLWGKRFDARTAQKQVVSTTISYAGALSPTLLSRWL